MDSGTQRREKPDCEADNQRTGVVDGGPNEVEDETCQEQKSNQELQASHLEQNGAIP